MHLLASRTGLVAAIDRNLHLLKVHLPYHESDHVLNLAYNILAGGTCLEDIERQRNDEAYLDGLGAQRIPDPTTEGDFCRRPSCSHPRASHRDGSGPCEFAMVCLCHTYVGEDAAPPPDARPGSGDAAHKVRIPRRGGTRP